MLYDSINDLYDKGKGAICFGNTDLHLYIYIESINTEVNNVVIKPMLTTNLNATYDDFVPYTGSTGSLNSDVAELRDKHIVVTKNNNIDMTVRRSIIGDSSAVTIPEGYSIISISIFVDSPNTCLVKNVYYYDGKVYGDYTNMTDEDLGVTTFHIRVLCIKN